MKTSDSDLKITIKCDASPALREIRRVRLRLYGLLGFARFILPGYWFTLLSK